MTGTLIGAALAAMLAGAPASGDTAPRRVLATQEQLAFSGVGRLDTGDGFCTATLVSERHALTAAHCLFGTDGALLPTAGMWFRAGLRDGTAQAVRQVRRAAVHPDWRFTGSKPTRESVSADLAMIELDQPLLTSAIANYLPGALPETGGAVALASYGRGRDQALSLQEPCRVLDRAGAIARLDCDVVPGSSGSPVLVRDKGRLHLGAVISAQGAGVAYATVVSAALPALEAALAAQGPGRRVETGRVQAAEPRPGAAGGLATRPGGWKSSRPPAD